ncbi:MAG: hypothetical protein EPO40_24945 [Myxococcaceae bacterium]|nr:MAG: hypothetical protein EPO40_24945 [Myxococcaceae bacterium]
MESEVAWGAGRTVQSVTLTVRRGGPTGPLRSARTTALGVGGERRPLPLLVGIVPADDTDTPVWIEALGCRAPNGCTVATAAVAQRAVVRFAVGQTEEVTLLLASACVGVTCGGDERCGNTGRCEPATRAVVRPFAGSDAGTMVDGAMDAGRVDAATVFDALTINDVPATVDVPMVDQSVIVDRSAVVDAGVDTALPDDCPASMTTPCPGRCVNTSLDPLNCGACGRTCATVGAVCAAGMCVCPGGGTSCGGTCVDIGIDPANCGACARVCADGEVCRAGACTCPAPRTICGSICSLTRSDPAHCGACGHSCTTGMRCWDGACSDVRVTQIAAGGVHSCARLSDGSARCWGYNRHNEFGDGTELDHVIPVVVPTFAGALEVHSGINRMCALITDGSVRCLNSHLTAPSSTARQFVLGGDQNWTCQRLAGGTVQCWGANDHGELGDGTTTAHAMPADVPGLRGVTFLATGGHSTCAVLDDATVRCWGYNAQGQLGDGTRIDRTAPVAVLGLTGVVDLAIGGSHSCARLRDGTVQCWGNGSSGQLGDGAPIRSVPAMVPGLTNVAQIVSGTQHSCSLMTGGTVRCWGSNSFGVLGDGSSMVQRTPVAVSGLSDVSSLASTRNHVCALRATGDVLCWGHNGEGEIGDGTEGRLDTGAGGDRPTPTRVLW